LCEGRRGSAWDGTSVCAASTGGAEAAEAAAAAAACSSFAACSFADVGALPDLSPPEEPDRGFLTDLLQRIAERLLPPAAAASALRRVLVALTTCGGWLERPALLAHRKTVGIASLPERQAVAKALGQARREAEAAYGSVGELVDSEGSMAGVSLGSLNTLYGADSANNARHPELWVRNAALLPTQLDDLMGFAQVPPPRLRPPSDFCGAGDGDFGDFGDFGGGGSGGGGGGGGGGLSAARELKPLLDAHGSDKASRHRYHLVYAGLLGRLGRHLPLRLLEIGLGTNDPTVLSSMGAAGKPGASARAFRDFLPSALVFGADVDAKCLFHHEPRIQTSVVDQYDLRTFDAMYAAFGSEPFDLIIDDGLHSIGSNLNTLLWALAHVRVGGYVVIEDIGPGKLPHWRLVDMILRHRGDALETCVVDTEPQKMYVVHRRA
jgi:hypothetical protein